MAEMDLEEHARYIIRLAKAAIKDTKRGRSEKVEKALDQISKIDLDEISRMDPKTQNAALQSAKKVFIITQRTLKGLKSNEHSQTTRKLLRYIIALEGKEIGDLRLKNRGFLARTFLSLKSKALKDHKNSTYYVHWITGGRHRKGWEKEPFDDLLSIIKGGFEYRGKTNAQRCRYEDIEWVVSQGIGWANSSKRNKEKQDKEKQGGLNFTGDSFALVFEEENQFKQDQERFVSLAEKQHKDLFQIHVAMNVVSNKKKKFFLRLGNRLGVEVVFYKITSEGGKKFLEKI